MIKISRLIHWYSRLGFANRELGSRSRLRYDISRLILEPSRLVSGLTVYFSESVFIGFEFLFPLRQ